jgi:sirohydrochlorin ferrochelatase
VGKHVRQDLPQMMLELRQHYPLVQFECTAAVGENESLLDLIANIAAGD